MVNGERTTVNILLGIDAYFFSISAESLEGNRTINFRKQREVFSHADVVTGMNFRAHLAHNDRTSLNNLPAKAFYAKSLSAAVPAIS